MIEQRLHLIGTGRGVDAVDQHQRPALAGTRAVVAQLTELRGAADGHAGRPRRRAGARAGRRWGRRGESVGVRCWGSWRSCRGCAMSSDVPVGRDVLSVTPGRHDSSRERRKRGAGRSPTLPLATARSPPCWRMHYRRHQRPTPTPDLNVSRRQPPMGLIARAPHHRPWPAVPGPRHRASQVTSIPGGFATSAPALGTKRHRVQSVTGCRIEPPDTSPGSPRTADPGDPGPRLLCATSAAWRVWRVRWPTRASRR